MCRAKVYEASRVLANQRCKILIVLQRATGVLGIAGMYHVVWYVFLVMERHGSTWYLGLFPPVHTPVLLAYITYTVIVPLGKFQFDCPNFVL